MFFTYLGRIAAILALALGVFQIAVGFLVAQDPSLAGRYSPYSSGETIDKGMIKVLFGIAIGVITDISRSLFKRDN